MTNITVRDQDGREINWETAVQYMDDEIREELHRELAPTTEQIFFDAYCKRHEEKFGSAFQVN